MQIHSVTKSQFLTLLGILNIAIAMFKEDKTAEYCKSGKQFKFQIVLTRGFRRSQETMKKKLVGFCMSVPRTDTGALGEKPMVCRDNSAQGSRQIGSVT